MLSDTTTITTANHALGKCLCKKSKPKTTTSCVPQKNKEGISISINNSHSDTQARASEKDSVSISVPTSRAPEVVHKSNPSLSLFPIILYLLILVSQIIYSIEYKEVDTGQTGEKRKVLGLKKIKNSRFIFHIIINFITGVICLLLISGFQSEEGVNYLYITFLSLFLVAFAMLYNFFRKY